MRIALTKVNERSLKDHLKEVSNVKLREKKQELLYVEDDIKRVSINLRTYLEKRKRISDDIIKEENNNESITDSLMSVNALSKVKEAYYETEDKHIAVVTEPLYFRTLNGGRYYLGNATIKYNTGNFGIGFDTNNHRRSYWGDDCPHPHVSTSGTACLGNTAELIASLQAEKEYGLIFEVLIAFLEQANTEDCAGRHAMNWDKVDEAGNVIQEGLKDYDGSRFKYGNTPEEDRVTDGLICACCGNDIDEDDDEMRTINGEDICGDCIDEHYLFCEVCQEWHDADDVGYYDELNMYVCNDCLNEDYRQCDVCGKYHHSDYSNYIESTEQTVCDHCLENEFTYCDVCDEYHPSNEVDYVEATDNNVCDECLNRYYVVCASCDEYVLAEKTIHDGADDVWLCTDCYEEKYADADEEVAADEEEELTETDREEIIEAINELSQRATVYEPEIAFPILTQVTRCGVCNDMINQDEAVIFGDETYCVSCAVEKL